VSQGPAPSDGLKRCVRCGAWIPDTVTRCSYCESSQQGSAPGGPSPAPARRIPFSMTTALIWANLAYYAFSLFVHVKLGGGSNLLGLLISGPGSGAMQRAGWYEHALTAGLGEWWRLMTACFLHAGAMHIGFNMFALHQLGRLAESIFGQVRFLAIYLVCGACSMFAGSVWHEFTGAPPVPVVGASGAIFGIAGLLIVFLKKHGSTQGKQLARALFKNIAILLVLGFVIKFISNTGHVGGLIPGMVFGFVVGDAFGDRVRPQRSQVWELAAALAVGATAVCLLHGVLFAWKFIGGS